MLHHKKENEFKLSPFSCRSLIFFNSATNKGLDIPYPAITLHAISRPSADQTTAVNGSSESISQLPYIYCQIDEVTPQNEDTEDEEEYSTKTLTITPRETGDSGLRSHIFPSNFLLLTLTQRCLVEAIFKHISFCASLHPADISDDDDNGPMPSLAMFADAEGDLDEGDEETGRVRSQYQNPNDRFRPY